MDKNADSTISRDGKQQKKPLFIPSKSIKNNFSKNSPRSASASSRWRARTRRPRCSSDLWSTEKTSSENQMQTKNNFKLLFISMSPKKEEKKNSHTINIIGIKCNPHLFIFFVDLGYL
jgi:hypothetical protein